HSLTSHKDNIILKFADDTAVIGQITGGDELAYRREVASLVTWCEDNNLTLNTDKTKEMIVDIRKERRTHQPLFIRELEMARHHEEPQTFAESGEDCREDHQGSTALSAVSIYFTFTFIIALL
ncbi:hypothetical protein QTP86_021275, partial [Hemibagrus guttatus]